jgi:ectoine hydroxylase-related dioxygenase (phytanoyl-CoA dioxygenase family)
MGAVQLLSKLGQWSFRSVGSRQHLLSSTEVTQYAGDGLVVPARRVPEQKLLELEDAIPEILRSDPHHTPDRFPHLLRDVRFVTAVVRFAQTAEILDVVEQLIGSDIVLWGAGVFGKPPIRGKATPWHQDAAFLEYQAIRPLKLCTAWVALDDSTAENGCLRYIRGSHQRRIIYHHKICNTETLTLDLALDNYNWTEADLQCTALKRGQLSIHDVYLIHGSDANRSGKRRAGLALRYMPATCCYDYDFAQRHNAPDRVMYLVRGVDRCGTNRLLPPP